MKVRHLMKELEKVNPEFEVLTEGCDCIGDSACIVEDQREKCVTIMRSPICSDYRNTDPPLEPKRR